MPTSNLDRLKLLRQKLEAKVQQKQQKHSLFDAPYPQNNKHEDSFQNLRDKNLSRLKELFKHLHIDAKHPDFHSLFAYKAMNLSGIGLKDDDFGQIREGKYVQIITIDYEPDNNGKKRARNKSLAYFGKSEKVDADLRTDIIEFVLRWRYEKAFQNVLHYQKLLERLSSSH